MFIKAMAYFIANFKLDTINMREYQRPLQLLVHFFQTQNGSELASSILSYAPSSILNYPASWRGLF